MPINRIIIAVVLSLLPCPAVWFGMYKLNSLIWTFFLYHGLCLVVVIWGWRLWKPHLLMPSARQWGLVLIAGLLTSVAAVMAYKLSGDVVVSRTEVLNVLTVRGFHATYLLPLAFYFVVINATLEELFWRGVVLNELDYVGNKERRLATIWTAFAFTIWHYLVLRALIRPGWAEIALGGVLAMGFFSSWLYRRTQSIVIPIVWHALVFDLAIIMMFAVLVLT